LNGNFTEFEIRRKSWPKEVPMLEAIQEGFIISGPGLEASAIRFSDGGGTTVSAETPWGKMTLQGEGRDLRCHFTVSKEDEPPVEIDMKPGSLILTLSNDVKLRFKNRSFWIHKYRFHDEKGLIEIRTETNGLLLGGPFQLNEWKKILKIKFIGQLSVETDAVLPSLTVFLCWFKLNAMGLGIIDTMF
jgi:hypothetical protein